MFLFILSIYTFQIFKFNLPTLLHHVTIVIPKLSHLSDTSFSSMTLSFSIIFASAAQCNQNLYLEVNSCVKMSLFLPYHPLKIQNKIKKKKEKITEKKHIQLPTRSILHYIDYFSRDRTTTIWCVPLFHCQKSSGPLQ